MQPGWLWLALAGLLILVAPALRPSASGARPRRALTPVLGSAPNVYYAVVPWLAYPLAGAVFGSMIARSADRTALFRRAAVVGAVLLVIGGALIAVQRPAFDVFTYWRSRPRSPSRSWGSSCSGWPSATSRRGGLVDRWFGFLYGWSDRVIAIYFAHWIIVGWGVGLVGFRALSLGPVLLAMAVAVVATSYLSRFAVKLETSWWLRRGPARGPSEVAVEVPAA